MQTPDARSRVWAINTFLRLSHLLGGARAQSLLGDYAEYLDRASADINATPLDLHRLRRTLHDLRSTSGMLGFEALADICLAILSDDTEAPAQQQMARLRDLARESLASAQNYIWSMEVTAA